MKRNLFYFTDVYPFGRGEATFVEPEIEYLSRFYDVTVVSLGYGQDERNNNLKSEILKKINLIKCDQKQFLLRIVFLIIFPFSKIAREECKRIVKSNKMRFKRILKVGFSYSRGRALQIQFRKNGIFDKKDTSCYYTFWFNDSLLACSFEQHKNPKESMNLITRIHGYDLYKDRTSFFWQSFQQFKANCARQIIFLTNKAQRYFQENYSIVSTKASVCALGTAKAPSIPSKENNSMFRIVSCSNVVPLKRLKLLVQSLALLSDLQIEWIHFGEGEQFKEVKSLAMHCNINAHFYGHVSHQALYSFYSNNYIDVFVTVSSSEGLPVSIEEALAFGIPIIGTDVGGISEEIQGNGILLSANPSAQDVADAIRWIYNASDDEILRMRATSYDLWSTRYNIENSLKRLKEIVEKEY